jgi:hypothetical protein
MSSFVSIVRIVLCLVAFSSLSMATAFDGPAELPRTSVVSALSSTPANGSTISVNAGGDLQNALNSAFCGDTIELQAGATFSGLFYLPAKPCSDSQWIIIRTSASNALLPAEGGRVTPCYAGVASLPGRPSYNCNSPQNVLARVQYTGSGLGPFIFRDGANHYRFIGLEITHTSGVRGAPVFISAQPTKNADHIIVDRSWLHGTQHDDTQNGVLLTGLNYVAVVDSYFSDFHCTAITGACTDAHAIGGGNGDHQDGPFKISNNFLEASGEAVMFGGGAATTTPADIEISHNHFFKPWQWMKGHSGYVTGLGGEPFIVKNHLELKNATRVLIENNLMENNWGGFSQTGYAILLNPKNQHASNNRNMCPICQVTDVTVRYTLILHAGAGIQLATSISGDGTNGAPAYLGTRWSIHDIVMDDINKSYSGGGSLFEIQNGWPKNPLNTVVINHITGFPDPTSHLAIMGNQLSNPDMYGFVFSNNLVATGQFPIWSTGGGMTSCAATGTPAQKIDKCFSTYTFTNNALIGTPDAFPPSSWPTGNFFPSNLSQVDFAPQGSSLVAQYALQSGSPYKNAGTDGRDLGADIMGLQVALSDVE